ncbi:DUF1800 domain-containing protein [Paludibaculum fermentans]|uniref:DUF1800 domain-containing protein n=1 Tax=Paludibaculum fermentans TaxID=1473598 RepID=UPI003EBCE8E0
MRPLLFLLAVPLLAAALHLTEEQRTEHLLSRATFGARPGDVQRVQQLGWKKWLDLQLHPGQIPEDPQLTEKLQPLESLRMSSEELARTYPRPKPQKNFSAADATRPPRPVRPGFRMAEATTQQRRDYLMEVGPPRVIAYDLSEAKILRAVYSNRQLEEVLTDFWFNHFNVFFDKGANRYLITSYERDAIRPNVLGKFKDLLTATAKHPAMLFYLDNWQSVAPGSQPRQKQRGLNENYARELMELHTMGVDGGYSQKDIVEVARCFTGWTIRQPQQGGGFFFAPRLHDRGEKTVLGVKIAAGGGEEDGIKVLELLGRHPATARFLSRELALRFVSDSPSAALIDRMAKEYLKSDGDLRAVVRTMFESKDFWSAEAYQSKIKSPLEFVASAVRAGEANVTFGFGLAQVVDRLGQPLYRKAEPTGYSNKSEEWVNSSGLVARLNFASALAANRVPGTQVDSAKYKDAGSTWGSPEFQKR